MFLTDNPGPVPVYGYICRLTTTPFRRAFVTVVDMYGRKAGDHWSWRSVDPRGNTSCGVTAIAQTMIAAYATAARIAADPKARARTMRANPNTRSKANG